MRKRPRTPRVVKIVFACVVFFCAVSFIHLQIKIQDRQSRLDDLNAQIAEQQSVNDAIRDQVENGVSDEYIASIAREHGYVMPNERVFKDASSK